MKATTVINSWASRTVWGILTLSEACAFCTLERRLLAAAPILHWCTISWNRLFLPMKMEIMNEISDLKTGFPPGETSISEQKSGRTACAVHSLSGALVPRFPLWVGWRAEVPDTSGLLGGQCSRKISLHSASAVQRGHLLVRTGLNLRNVGGCT